METALVLYVSPGWNRAKKCLFFPRCGYPTAKGGCLRVGVGGRSNGVMEMQGKRG